MSELIHEIEESLRQERLHAWWKEYGPYLIAGCILAVLFTAFSAGWRAHEAGVNGTQTAAIANAEAQPDPAAALDKIIPGLKPSLRGVALVSEAGALAQKNDNPGALKIYDRAVADGAIPEPLHSFAVLQDVRFAWVVRGKGADGQAGLGKALLAQLQPLIDDAKNPWHGEARLQAAIIAAHGLNDTKQARAFLAPLLAAAPDKTDMPHAGDTLQERAVALDHVYATTSVQ